MRQISSYQNAVAFMWGAVLVVSAGCGVKKTSDGDAGGGIGGNGALGTSTGGTPGPEGGEGGSGPSGGRGGTGGSAGSGGAAPGGRGGGAGGAGGMAGGCPTGTHVAYTAAGCGTKAKPLCGSDSGAGGGCISAVCDCNGKVRTVGCGTSPFPFAYFTGSEGILVGWDGMTSCDPEAGPGGASGGSKGGAGGGASSNDGGTDACSVDTGPRLTATPLGDLCPADRGTASCVPGTYCHTTIVCACGAPEFMDNFVCDCSGHFQKVGGVDPADCFGPCPTGGRSGG